MSGGASVNCVERGDGWACSVTVGDDAAATTHEVTVSRDVLARLRPDEVAPDGLVADSFAFLLAREPREPFDDDPLQNFEVDPRSPQLAV